MIDSYEVFIALAIRISAGKSALCKYRWSQIKSSTSSLRGGSILGPLFFLVYINDLLDYVIHSKLLLFADDAKCLKRIACLEDITHLVVD